MDGLVDRFNEAMPGGRRSRRRGAVAGEDIEKLAKQVVTMKLGARVAGGGGRRMVAGGGARVPAAHRHVQPPPTVIPRYHPYRRQSWCWEEEQGSDPLVDPFLNQIVEVEANGCVFRGKLTALTKPSPRAGPHARAVKLSDVVRVGGDASGAVMPHRVNHRIFRLEDVAALNIPMSLRPPAHHPITSPRIEVLDSDGTPLPPSPCDMPLPDAERDPFDFSDAAEELRAKAGPALAGMDLLAFILGNMNITD